MTAKMQRIAMAVWPVTVMVLAPLIVFKAVNLWRKNRLNFQRSTANER